MRASYRLCSATFAALVAAFALTAVGCDSDDSVSGATTGTVGDTSGGDSAGQLGDSSGGDSLSGESDGALLDTTDAAAGSDAPAGTDGSAGTDATGGSDAAGMSECLSALPCIDACEKGGTSSQQCFGECLVDLSPDAQKQFVAFAGCLADGKFETDPTCPDKMNACVQPSGNGGCMDFLSCTQDCQGTSGSTGMVCMISCLQGISSTKTATVLSAMGCFGKEDTACQQKLQACFADTTGTVSCGQVALCGGKCKEGDAKCGFDCLKEGTPAAVSEFIQVQQCFEGQQQASSLCNGIIGKCLGTGTGTCAEGLTCMGECGDNATPGCFFDCLSKLTSTSASQLMATGQCFDGKYATTCPADISACVAPSGSKSCWGIVECLQASCKQTDDFTCAKACWVQGSKKGLEDFVAATHCIDDCKSKCDPTKPDCPTQCEQTCGGQFPACLPPG